MSLKKLSLSFDDGLKDQFKWARGLYRYGYQATFFINPSRMRHVGFLKLDWLKKMHDEWGHIIANHLWTHECPNTVDMSILIRNCDYAAEWLTKHGFGDGVDLVALPYGSLGGEWTDEYIAEMFKHCSLIRDVSLDGDKIYDGTKRVYAYESTIPLSDGEGIASRYFHGNHNTFDKDFVGFLDYLKDEDVDVITLREIADAL